MKYYTVGSKCTIIGIHYIATKITGNGEFRNEMKLSTKVRRIAIIILNKM